MAMNADGHPMSEVPDEEQHLYKEHIMTMCPGIIRDVDPAVIPEVVMKHQWRWGESGWRVVADCRCSFHNMCFLIFGGSM